MDKGRTVHRRNHRYFNIQMIEEQVAAIVTRLIHLLEHFSRQASFAVSRQPAYRRMHLGTKCVTGAGKYHALVLTIARYIVKRIGQFLMRLSAPDARRINRPFGMDTQEENPVLA